MPILVKIQVVLEKIFKRICLWALWQWNIFGKDQCQDASGQIWFKSIKWFSKRRFWMISIISPVTGEFWNHSQDLNKEVNVRMIQIKVVYIIQVVSEKSLFNLNWRIRTKTCHNSSQCANCSGELKTQPYTIIYGPSKSRQIYILHTEYINGP